MPQYLDGLNEQQYAAVTAGKGPVLVVAGAGSGKTRVLTNRIAYLMDEMNVPSHQIMAVTFTNKAAKEMQDRLSALLEDASYGLWVGTFHRICLRILRMEGEAIGIDRDFVIYDDADQRSLVKSLLKQQGVEDMVTPAAALRMISDAKNKMYSPEAYEEMAFSTEEEIVARTYKYYEQQKRANNALDFDDLLICTVELFSTCHDVLTEYRERFEYILVDEYQDTNEAQYRLLKMLAGKNGNLFVVGDPDQSIYAFRGAQIENILNYQRDYPGAAVFRLEKNYRSTQQILNVANALISHNGNRLEKNLFTDRVGEQNVEAMLVSDEKDEALFVAENARRMVNDGKYRYSDMAVFYRTHAQSRVIEEKL
ncbi:MAG: UvrD-helicase domain-containing protein, partial [Firmicutes bacterium]|nr:UvrD-helicase domain-containing protein [Bacillota bacterium]